MDNNNDDKNDQLFKLIKAKNKDEVEKLLKQGGVNINAKDSIESNTALILAVQGNDKDITKLLLEYGADINEGDKLGMTPIMHATINRNEKIVKLLLERTPDTTKENAYGKTVFYYTQNTNEKIKNLFNTYKPKEVSSESAEDKIEDQVYNKASRVKPMSEPAKIEELKPQIEKLQKQRDGKLQIGNGCCTIV